MELKLTQRLTFMPAAVVLCIELSTNFEAAKLSPDTTNTGVGDMQNKVGDKNSFGGYF